MRIQIPGYGLYKQLFKCDALKVLNSLYIQSIIKKHFKITYLIPGSERTFLRGKRMFKTAKKYFE